MMSSILYHNSDYSVCLIDIPTSIASAQVPSDARRIHDALSCDAPEQPFEISNEPKDPDARNRIRDQDPDYELHAHYRQFIAHALKEIKRNSAGAWCLPRHILLATDARHGQRDRTHRVQPLHVGARALPDGRDAASDRNKDDHEPPTDLILDLSRSSDQSYCYTATYVGADNIKGHDANLQSPWHVSFHNARRETAVLQVSSYRTAKSGSFYVPPHSSFFLGNCANPGTFRAEFRNTCQEFDMGRRFDLMLLDPPWPNASARRKRAYSTYQSVAEVQQLITRMDLDAYLANNGVVAVWITNKPRVRAAIVGPGGLFEQLHVGLAEEWIWAKVTKNGTPITALESLWRKPYEVLLLGRATFPSGAEAPDVVRRVIAGVPDLHSRKPCLKELLERLTTLPQNYNAIEIFARHLVSGWWSWGDEAIKFNWQGYWTAADNSDMKQDNSNLK